MLRHTSLNTTQRYVHSLQDENRAVLSALPEVVPSRVEDKLYGIVKRGEPDSKAPVKAPAHEGEQN